MNRIECKLERAYTRIRIEALSLTRCSHEGGSTILWYMRMPAGHVDLGNGHANQSIPEVDLK
jgi:hypothetical protein